MPITGRQVKAARQLLGWTQDRLAAEVRVSPGTISAFERDRLRLSMMILSTIQRALMAAGVEFIEGGPGVKLRDGKANADDKHSAISDEAALPTIPEKDGPYDGSPI